MAVIIADQPVGELPNIVGQTIEYYFTNVPTVQTVGDFHIWNYTKIAEVAASHNNTITEEVYRQIHHQKFWAAFMSTRMQLLIGTRPCWHSRRHSLLFSHLWKLFTKQGETITRW